MKNISRLKKDIDSIKDNNLLVLGAFSKNITTRMGAFVSMAEQDSTLTTTGFKYKTKKDSLFAMTKVKDTVRTTSDVLDLYQNWQKSQIMSAASNAISNIVNSVSGKKQDIQNKYKIYNMHILSLHKKYALALSCIILFFVGAPLAHPFHDILRLGLLPQLVKGIFRFGQFGQQGGGRPLHDDSAVHALGFHIQPVEQDMDKTDRVPVKNEKRYFFHASLTIALPS